MKVIGLNWALVIVWLSCLLPAFGQLTDAEKKQFQQIKSRAESGDAQAQLSLGSMYASGIGVGRDLFKAAKWHRKAAEQGLARAQLRVAYEYAFGDGVKTDHVEAAKWLRRAADQGLADAQYQLGFCYINGDGVTENHVEAVKWYRKAAEQQYPDAEHALGNCYLEGNGVTKDTAEGVAWLRKGAEQGFAPAENSLGLCYAKGKGVNQDYVEAYKWFDLAAAQGGEHDVDAKMNLSMAERSMTPDQIAKAQELAHTFQPHSAKAPSTAPQSTAAVSKTTNASGVSASSGKTGVLNVKADDDTFEVFLDGAFVGNSPAKLKLEPGSHLIEVKKSGFKDFRKTITITDGSELNLRAVLERQ
jgi:TPR repeat protein